MKKLWFLASLILLAGTVNAAHSDRFLHADSIAIQKNRGQMPVEGKMERKMKRLDRKLKKMQEKMERRNARKSSTADSTAMRLLFFSAALLLTSILLFAFATSSTLISILGSLVLIGAAIFFILWLRRYTSAKTRRMESGETDS